jgi:hypothetical protein
MQPAWLRTYSPSCRRVPGKPKSRRLLRPLNSAERGSDGLLRNRRLQATQGNPARTDARREEMQALARALEKGCSHWRQRWRSGCCAGAERGERGTGPSIREDGQWRTSNMRLGITIWRNCYALRTTQWQPTRQKSRGVFSSREKWSLDQSYVSLWHISDEAPNVTKFRNGSESSGGFARVIEF